MTTNEPTKHAPEPDEQHPPSGAGGDSLGQELAHPSQITEAAGDAPSSSGPHGADAVGSDRPPRPEDVAPISGTGREGSGAGPAADLGDADAPLPAAASGEQFDRDAPDLTEGVTEHSATPRSWQRERRPD
jgi:hypothetical protein